MPSANPGGDFWAITCFYNPAGARRRLANYLTFRRHLQVPLVTVQLIYPEQTPLPADAADILITLHGRDVLWQKERLLNVALAALPSQCRKVAWIDADLVFEDADWPARTSALLDNVPLVQPFRDVYELSASEEYGTPGAGRGASGGYSLAYALATGQATPDLLRGNMRLQGFNSGLAWAARRELFTGIGFYDACIVGSGNRAMACAALGQPEHAVHYLRMGDRWAAHYRAWADRHYADVRGRVGMVEGGLVHLWHGDLRNRQYAARHVALSQFGFDPAVDIALDDSGAWRWNSDKPALHRYICDYLASRREDG